MKVLSKMPSCSITSLCYVVCVDIVYYCVLADSLVHRAAAAEMLYLLEPNKKSEAVKLIEDSSNNIVSQ